MNSILPQIRERVEQMPRIASAPQQLLMKLSDPEYSVSEITRIIEADVSLATRCLQVVNSAGFGIRHRIASIKQAINLLGSQNLISIALMYGFEDIFKTHLSGYRASQNEFWETSLRTAIASRMVAMHTAIRIAPDMAYTSGLLLDIGKAIISGFLETFQSDLLSILAKAPEHSRDFLDIENSILGTNHAVVGGALAEKWNFPEPLTAAIRFHHSPADAPEPHRGLAMVAHIANMLATLSGASTSIDAFAYKVDDLVAEHFALNRNDFSKLLFEVDMKFRDLIGKILI